MNNKKSQWLALPYAVYAVIFIAAPLLLIVLYSFCTDPQNGIDFTMENFVRFFDFANPMYMQVLWRSIYLAIISTIICLLLGYPMAYILSQLSPRVRGVVSVLFILPMWMNFLLRTYSWMSLLEKTGLINRLLEALSLPSLDIMYTQWAVVLGNVYNFLPFMILPIYNVLIKIDKSVVEAAQDLGAPPYRVFTRVIFPLSLGGVASGITMTFMPAVTTFVISKLLGGGQNTLIGDLIEKQFKVTGNWGFGSAMSVIIMVLILIAMNITPGDKEESAGGTLL
ncbi:MAG: ABC transporter permease [Clostridia bacterium]|nr:ABC transporter permease [Oscillospiraceae bacterium]MBR6747412.1 ABC transporter permease [Clostridia bacterium]